MNVKESIAGSSETLVLEANLDLCIKVRKELIDHFSYVWFYLYTKSPKSTSAVLTVCNAFGGKMEKKLADEVVAHAKTVHDRLKN